MVIGRSDLPLIIDFSSTPEDEYYHHVYSTMAKTSKGLCGTCSQNLKQYIEFIL
jgi:hypothetical protein